MEATRYEIDTAVSLLKDVALREPKGETLEAFTRHLEKIARNPNFQNRGKYDTRNFEALRALARGVGGNLEFGPNGAFKKFF